MTGKEHYEAAERVLRELDEAGEEGALLPANTVMAALAKAQVHATLALVWATHPEHATYWGEGEETARRPL